MKKNKDVEPIEITTTLVAVLDHQGRILFFNKNSEVATGLLFKDIQGKEFWELLADEDEKEQVKSLYVNYDPDLLPRNISTHLNVNNGEAKAISWSSRIILNKDNTVDRIICFGKEITEGKQAESEPSKTDTSDSNSATVNPDSFIVSDAQGKLLDINDAYCSMTGFTKQEILSTNISDIFEGKEPGEINDRVNSAISSGNVCFNCGIKCKNGISLNVEASATYSSVNGGMVFYSIRRPGITIEHTIKELPATKVGDIKINMRAQIVDNTTDSIFIYDFNGNFVYINAPAYSTRGYTREEMMNLSFYDLCTYEEVKTLESHVKDIPEKNKITCQIVHRCKDSTTINVELQSRIIYINNRKLILSVVRDVTETSDLKKRSQGLFEICQDGYLIVDFDEKIIDVNAFCCQLLGYSREELLKMKVIDLTLPDKYHEVIGKIKEDQHGHFNCRLRSKENRMLETEIHSMEVDNGNILLFIKDVTEKINMAASLREREGQYSLLKDNSMDLVYRIQIKPELKVTYISDPIAAYSGHSPGEIYERPLLLIRSIHPADRVIVKLLLNEKEYFNKHVTVRIIRDGNDITWLDLFTKPVYNEKGDIEAIEGIAHNISDVERLLEKQKVNAVINKAITDLGHSINALSLSDKEIGMKVLKYAREITFSEYAFLFPIAANPGDTGYSSFHEVLIDGLNGNMNLADFVMVRDERGKCASFYNLDTRSDKPFMVNSSSIEYAINCISDRDLKLTNILYIPLSYDNRTVGQIILANSPGKYNEDDLAVVERISSYYILAIKQKEYESVCQQLQIRDVSLADNVDKGILFLDQNNCISFINKVASEMLGWKPVDSIGRKFVEFVVPDRREDIEAYLENNEENHSIPQKFLVISQSEGIVPVNILAIPLTGNSNDYCGSILLCSGIEITQSSEISGSENTAVNNVFSDVSGRGEKRLRILNEMNQMLVSCLNSTEAYKIFTQYLPRMFPNTAGMLLLLNSNINLYESVMSWGTPLESEIVFDADSCWAARRNKPHFVSDIANDELCRHISGKASRTYSDIPLNAGGKSIGILHIEAIPSKKDGAENGNTNYVDGADGFALLVSQQLSSILTNIQLQKRINELAIFDTSTGLYSRSYMEQLLDREIHIAFRNKTLTGIILIEMDDLQKFNAFYGSRMSDMVMKKTGEYLKLIVRQDDIVCSSGAGTFGIIVSSVSSDILKQQSEIIADKVKNISKEYKELPFATTAVSKGTAVFPENGASGEEIIRAAYHNIWDSKQKNGHKSPKAEITAHTIF
jgi:diguanylate cyclase (GGDEF)-like protein/PAS domain S-box-containing protein